MNSLSQLRSGNIITPSSSVAPLILNIHSYSGGACDGAGESCKFIMSINSNNSYERDLDRSSCELSECYARGK